MLKRLIFATFFIFINFVNGQENIVLLKKYSDSLRFHEKDYVRSIFNDSFNRLIKKVFEDSENPMLIDLTSINQTISVLESQNKKLKVITWTLVNDTQSYQNFGIVLYQKNLKSECKIIYLKPLEKKIKKVEYEELNQMSGLVVFTIKFIQ